MNLLPPKAKEWKDERVFRKMATHPLTRLRAGGGAICEHVKWEWKRGASNIMRALILQNTRVALK